MIHDHTFIFFHLKKPINIIFTNDFYSDELYIWKNDSHLSNKL